MKLQNIITEGFSTVSINGIMYSLNNDEKSIYDKIKKDEDRKLFKKDLDEFDQRIASNMVTRGILQRRKNPQHEIYFTTRGRRKNAIFNRPLDEVAPPDMESEKWINKNKDRFKERYGKNYKKYLYGKAWNLYNGKKIDESFTHLFEGVTDLQKYYPNIPLERLKALIALDPTYKGGEQLGKYGKWIINLVNNKLKNENNQKQFQELLKKYPDGINPKTGQKFQEPAMLPAIDDEDLHKLPDSLKQYNINQKQIGKPLEAFKTLPELDKALAGLKNAGIPTNELALKRYNIMQKAVSEGLDIVYEDNNWIVGIPTTLDSSIMFGNDTSWCTTSPNGRYYEYYTKSGPLFINLNKQTGELYQFHFESESFMDEHDAPINLKALVEEFSPDMKKYYNNYINSSIDKNDDNKQYLFLFNSQKIDKKTEADMIEELKYNPKAFKYISNPTEKICDIVLKSDIKNIAYIPKPTEKQIVYFFENARISDYEDREACEMLAKKMNEKEIALAIKTNYAFFSSIYKTAKNKFNENLLKTVVSNIDWNDKNLDTQRLNIEFTLDNFKYVFELLYKKDINFKQYYFLQNSCNYFVSMNNPDEILKKALIFLNPPSINILLKLDPSIFQQLIDVKKNFSKYITNIVYGQCYKLFHMFDSSAKIDEQTMDKIIEFYQILKDNDEGLFPIGNLFKFCTFEQAEKILQINLKTFNDYLQYADDENIIKMANNVFAADKDELKNLAISMSWTIRNLEKLIRNYNLLDIDIQSNVLYVIIYAAINANANSRHELLQKIYRKIDNIPYSIQKFMASQNIKFVKYIKNVDPRLQKKLIEKNPFNIKYINNPSEDIIKMAYEKNPDTKDYIR